MAYWRTWTKVASKVSGWDAVLTLCLEYFRGAFSLEGSRSHISYRKALVFRFMVPSRWHFIREFLWRCDCMLSCYDYSILRGHQECIFVGRLVVRWPRRFLATPRNSLKIFRVLLAFHHRGLLLTNASRKCINNFRHHQSLASLFFSHGILRKNVR